MPWSAISAAEHVKREACNIFRRYRFYIASNCGTYSLPRFQNAMQRGRNLLPKPPLASMTWSGCNVSSSCSAHGCSVAFCSHPMNKKETVQLRHQCHLPRDVPAAADVPPIMPDDPPPVAPLPLPPDPVLPPMPWPLLPGPPGLGPGLCPIPPETPPYGEVTEDDEDE